MKKLGAFLLGVGLIAGVTVAADSNTATSVNIVGFQTINCPKGVGVLVSTAFESIDGAVMKSVDVFGTNSLPVGTLIYAWDQTLPAGPGYRSDLLKSKGGVTSWETNVTYRGGMGFWIIVPAIASSNSYNVVMAGQVPMASSITNVVYSGPAMLGFPYTASVVWTNTPLAQNAIDGSILYLWDVVTTGWISNVKGKGKWSDNNMQITQDKGFWFIPPISQPTITNIDVRPYNP